MAALHTPEVTLGTQAPDFLLPATDGKTYRLADIRGENGTVIVFICNHCPFVQSIADKLTHDARNLQAMGVGMAAINANDAEAYPEDSFEHMQGFAAEHGFNFPYLYDETQEVARAYGAICTPDVFGYDQALKLRYRGRVDAAGMRPSTLKMRRDLVEAMRQIAQTGEAPHEQVPSIGCSIKWRRGAA